MEGVIEIHRPRHARMRELARLDENLRERFRLERFRDVGGHRQQNRLLWSSGRRVESERCADRLIGRRDHLAETIERRDGHRRLRLHAR